MRSVKLLLVIIISRSIYLYCCKKKYSPNRPHHILGRQQFAFLETLHQPPIGRILHTPTPETLDDCGRGLLEKCSGSVVQIDVDAADVNDVSRLAVLQTDF